MGCSQQSSHTPTDIHIDISNEKEEQLFIQHLQELSIVDTSKTYKSVVQEILKEREGLSLQNLSSDSISALFKEALLYKVIPFWEGTKWSFEGHSSQPKKGRIACGYFVSTTLRDVGLHLNRYKLAQQSPINEAKSLAIHSEVKEFYANTKVENIEKMKEELKEGIHFIGFDQSHVGYLLNEGGQLYLIHSNYINQVGVMIEPIEQSDVFGHYNRFFITELSTNPHLLDCWINNTSIGIVK